MVVGELLRVARKEVPVQRCERTGVIASALLRVESAPPAGVAHLVDVRAARRIRLRRHHPAVSVQCHPDHVRQHHPLRTVDEARPHPLGHRPRIDAGRERKIAEHHQTLDVMGVPMRIEMADGVGHARHLGRRPAGERWWYGPRCLEVVTRSIVGHPPPVDAPHVLAPPQHLPDEPLDRVDRQVAFA